jgi:chemotaxis family two-component system response regulator Rcp1
MILDGEARRPYEILLVEPSSSDAVLMREAFRENGSRSGVTIVSSGPEALNYLSREERSREMPWPDLVLYSLDVARPESVQALTQLKNAESTRRIPVVVLADHEGQETRQRIYDLHANCIVPRPSSFDQFRRVVHSIERFWLTIVTLPRE